MKVAIAFILAVALFVAILSLAVTIIVANINDMIAQGEASFWPVLWILLTLTFVFGGSSAAASKQ